MAFCQRCRQKKVHLLVKRYSDPRNAVTPCYFLWPTRTGERPEWGGGALWILCLAFMSVPAVLKVVLLSTHHYQIPARMSGNSTPRTNFLKSHVNPCSLPQLDCSYLSFSGHILPDFHVTHKNRLDEMSSNIRCDSDAGNLCSVGVTVFTVKWYECLEFPANEFSANELLFGAQREQNPFSKILCTFSERRWDRASCSLESFIPEPVLKSFTMWGSQERVLWKEKENHLPLPSPRSTIHLWHFARLKKP